MDAIRMKEAEACLKSTTKKDGFHRNRRILIVLTACSLLVTFALLCVFLTFSQNSKIEFGDSICFACNSLGKDVNSKDTLYDIYRTNNSTICCYGQNDRNTKLIRKLMSHYTNEEEKGDFSKELAFILGNRTGAHLHLNTMALLEGNLSWNSHGPLSYLSGVNFSADALIIPEAGQYLVYSYVTFTRKYPDTHGGEVFIHSVTRSHPRQPNLGVVRVLVSSNTYPQSTANKSSFLSAVLLLRKGDHIKVNVSDKDSVQDDSKLSYFGVLRI